MHAMMQVVTGHPGGKTDEFSVAVDDSHAEATTGVVAFEGGDRAGPGCHV